MKKVLVFIVMISILLTSCSMKDNKADYFGGEYFTYINDNGKRIPAKLNPATGNITSFCNDPLCDHGAECPFYNYFGGWADGDRIYYIADDFIGEVSIRYYEISTGHVSLLAVPEHEPEGGYIFTDKYIYYAYREFDSLNLLRRCRVDKKSGKQVFIERTWYDTGLRIWDGKNIYIAEPRGIVRYDEDLNNEKVLNENPCANLTDCGEYIYFTTNSGICRINKRSLQSELIYSCEKMILLTAINNDAEGEIFFLTEQDEPAVIGKYSDGSNVPDTFGNKLYHLNKDGSVSITEINIPEKSDGKHFISYIEGTAGSYVLLKCGYISSDFQFTSRFSLISVNVVTGECLLIDM